MPVNETIKPILKFLWLSPIAFGACYFCGTQIATSEVGMQKLDEMTAAGHFIQAVRDVPAGTVLRSQDVQAVDTFANRVEGDMLARLDQVVGKKVKYGLVAKQAIVSRDLMQAEKAQ
jgi:Chaperone for flagella basal body P-ring formation